MIAARFDLDTLLTAVPGYHDPRVRWNGFACPCFTFDSARQIAERFGGTFDEATSEFTTWDEGDEEPDRWASQVVLIDGVETKVWAIGAFGWVWTKAVCQVESPSDVAKLFVGYYEDDVDYDLCDIADAARGLADIDGGDLAAITAHAEAGHTLTALEMAQLFLGYYEDKVGEFSFEDLLEAATKCLAALSA